MAGSPHLHPPPHRDGLQSPDFPPGSAGLPPGASQDLEPPLLLPHPPDGLKDGRQLSGRGLQAGSLSISRTNKYLDNYGLFDSLILSMTYDSKDPA